MSHWWCDSRRTRYSSTIHASIHNWMTEILNRIYFMDTRLMTLHCKSSLPMKDKKFSSRTSTRTATARLAEARGVWALVRLSYPPTKKQIALQSSGRTVCVLQKCFTFLQDVMPTQLHERNLVDICRIPILIFTFGIGGLSIWVLNCL